jgi:hypothetical protein
VQKRNGFQTGKKKLEMIKGYSTGIIGLWQTGSQAFVATLLFDPSILRAGNSEAAKGKGRERKGRKEQGQRKARAGKSKGMQRKREGTPKKRWGCKKKGEEGRKKERGKIEGKVCVHLSWLLYGV